MRRIQIIILLVCLIAVLINPLSLSANNRQCTNADSTDIRDFCGNGATTYITGTNDPFYTLRDGSHGPDVTTFQIIGLLRYILDFFWRTYVANSIW